MADSDKPFKKNEHSRERGQAKQTFHSALYQSGDIDAMEDAFQKAVNDLTPKKFGNPWKAPKDGKHYWKKATAKDMRK